MLSKIRLDKRDMLINEAEKCGNTLRPLNQNVNRGDEMIYSHSNELIPNKQGIFTSLKRGFFVRIHNGLILARKNRTTMKLSIYIFVVGLVLAAVSYGQCPNVQGLKSNFQQKPAATQAKVWRDHYRFALATEKLSADQKDFISETLALTKDGLYTQTKDAATIAQFTDMATQAKSLFTDALQLKRIFYTLTAEEMQGFSLTPAAYFRLSGNEGTCSCNVSDNVLCDECVLNDQRWCDRTSWGCGFGWILPCTGICVNFQNT